MSRIGPLVPAARDGTPLSAPRPPATPCSGSACSVEQLLLSGQDPWELESADTPTSTLPPGIQQTCWRHRWEPARITLRWHTADHLAILLQEISWQRQLTPQSSAATPLRRWAEQVRTLPWELIPTWSVCELDESLQEGLWRSPCLPEADGICYYELQSRMGSQAEVHLRAYRVAAQRRREQTLFPLPRPALVRLLTSVHTALSHCCG
jgi:hypothetical protein